MEIVGHNGEIISDRHDVLDKWKTSFSKLHQRENEISVVDNNLDLDQRTNISEYDDAISVLEICRAIFKAKRKKACGIDWIPSDVFRNDCSVSILHVLFNTCYAAGVILDGVSPSVFRCTSTPMETGPIDACVET